MTNSDNINEQIAKAKQELEHMIDLNPSIMLLVDKTHTIVRANKAVLELLNLSDFTNVLNRELKEVFAFDEQTVTTELVAKKTESKGIKTTVTIDGNKHLLQFTPIGSSPDADLFALIVNDITTEKELATKQEKQHKREAVKALMGALLHNVNQPLTVIMMRAQLMHLELEKGSHSPGTLSDNLRDIMRQTASIATLLRQAEVPKDYVTKQYSPGVDILDIDLSAGNTDFDITDIGIPQALILALDVHEPGALKHSQNGSKYALQIALQLKLNKDECNKIKRCALLHDIGKIGIPESILRKPGPLDEEETKLMQQHPEIGYKLLQHFNFMQDEAETAYTHAEWFDGTGYPQGLSGKQIPLHARIVAVADAYSAITEERSYKESHSAQDALKEISTYAGTQFDPEVVRALLNSQQNTAQIDL